MDPCILHQKKSSAGHVIKLILHLACPNSQLLISKVFCFQLRPAHYTALQMKIIPVTTENMDNNCDSLLAKPQESHSVLLQINTLHCH